ncbi:MAG: ABC transporter ATP-binding protein [Candidatus Methanomethylicia archaeon]|nr:ABC transporter ATP-binding protein [Candidatus Methanomethylicia archaeon]
MKYVIETEGLTKIYRSEGKIIKALDNLNLKVECGKIFGLLGPNGSGKITLIMTLIGLIMPTSGSARVLGFDIIKDSIEIRKRVGVLPEGADFYDHLTAKQNLLYVEALNGIGKTEREKRVEELLKIVGLEDAKDRRVGGFSRGMKQRLGIAQALLKNPELLIFDEPTAGLDPEAARTFKNFVLKLKNEGKTIMLSTHLLFEVGPLCDDIAIINLGRIVLQGSVKELVERFIAEEGYKIRVQGKGVNIGSFTNAILNLKDVKNVKIEKEYILVEATRDIRAEINRLALDYDIEIIILEFITPTIEDLFIKYYKWK